ERSMIVERVKSGLRRAVAQGKKLGRPRVDHETERKVLKLLKDGVGIKRTARTVGVGVATVQRIKAASQRQAIGSAPRRSEPERSRHGSLGATRVVGLRQAKGMAVFQRIEPQVQGFRTRRNLLRRLIEDRVVGARKRKGVTRAVPAPPPG